MTSINLIPQIPHYTVQLHLLLLLANLGRCSVIEDYKNNELRLGAGLELSTVIEVRNADTQQDLVTQKVEESSKASVREIKDDGPQRIELNDAGARGDDDDDTEEDDTDEGNIKEYKRNDKKASLKGPKIWDHWGKWSQCSVTCGVGKITRWRHCVSGGCASGEKEAQIKTCTLPAC